MKALLLAALVASVCLMACGGSGPESYTCQDIKGDGTKLREVAQKVHEDFGRDRADSYGLYGSLVAAACQGERSAKPYELLKEAAS